MKKKILLLALVIASFAVGYGAVAHAYPWPWPYDRNEYRGYWEDRYDSAGKYVLAASCSGAYSYWNGQDSCNAFPNWMDTPGEFTSYVIDKYHNGSSTDSVGAAFIILTMIGEDRSWPVSGGEEQEFINRVNALAPYTSWATTGFTYNLNSYNQRGNNGVGPNDIAFYDDFASGHRTIVFRNSSGQVAYVIKTRCANPVGFNSVEPLPDDANFTIAGSARVAANRNPRPGETVRFEYLLGNNGPTSTSPTNIWWAAFNSRTGAYINGGNNGVMNPGPQTVIYTENYIVPTGTPAGTLICRLMGWDPINSGGARDGRSAEDCATVRHDFTLVAAVTLEINDGATPGDAAEPGDKVEFIYTISNSGTTDSQPVNCNIYGLARNGFYATPTPSDSVSDPGFVPPAHGCPRVIPYSTGPPTVVTLVTETIASVSPADINKTICRSLYINPISPSGGSDDSEACVKIVAKPYFRTYGGDLSAGGGQTVASGGCTNNASAAIIGWNRGGTQGYAGAGIQFAGLALGRIYDVATSLNNGAGAAPTPRGLGFINSPVPAGNTYGGLFNSAPCIPDYYDPTGATPLPAGPIRLNTLPGIHRYSASGPRVLGGIVNPNQRSVIYVDGDVLIDDNIRFPGSWTAGSLPQLQVIVEGDIYISRTVTDIAGVFIAQRNSLGAGGTIYTCANPALPAAAILPSSGALYTNCRTKLTINGSFIANRVQLLRTGGTLRQALPGGESGTSANIAEVFNFGPSLWMAQPPTISGSAGGYDAITSLPPIL